MEQMKWKELFMKYKVQIGVVVAVILVVAVAALAGGAVHSKQQMSVGADGAGDNGSRVRVG